MCVCVCMCVYVCVCVCVSDSSFIRPLYAHAVFERSTDKKWHNPFRTSSDGWNKVAWFLATQKQEYLSVNN